MQKITPARIALAIHGFNSDVKDIAMEIGFTKGHKDYQRFIILGRPRTGSNLLHLSLRLHNRIISYGELFSSKHQTIRGYPRYRHKSKHLMELRDGNPIKFVDQFIYRKYPRSISAVGFKIFYGQAQTPDSII